MARLERDADARVAAIEERSRQQIEDIEAERARAASGRQAGALAAQRAERRSRLDRELADARRRARTTALCARRAAIERVMARVAQLLEGASKDPAYVSALPARLRQALRFAGDDAVVRCNADTAPAVRRALKDDPRVVVLEVAMDAGVTVAAHDGSMELCDTLPARLAAMREELAIDLLREVSDER